MVSGSMLKLVIHDLEEELRKVGREVNADDITSIVNTHALTTAASAAAAGVVPGAGSTIALGIACTSTVVMYGRLAKAVGVRLNNGLIKAVAAAVGADLSAYIATFLLASAAVSFIPFFGSLSAAAMTGISNFAFVYIAGIIFLKIIAKFGVTRIESMSESELTRAAKDAQSEVDFKQAMKEAKQVYKSK